MSYPPVLNGKMQYLFWKVLDIQTMNQTQFDCAWAEFLQKPEYDAAKAAMFAVTRAAFLAGWLAAGGDAPQEERLFQVLPGGAPET